MLMVGDLLRVTEGKERGKLLSVEVDLLLGRSAPEDEGRLGGDPKISRRHARVSRGADGRLAIEDLGSANGTFVNDEQIDGPRTLEVGDVIRLGRTVLKVTVGAADVPRTPTEVPASDLPNSEPDGVLVVTAGGALGHRFTVTDELVLGRGMSGDGRLSDDPELSRRHARVARDANGRLSIEDLGSANGTFVNGERVLGRRRLRLGDSVRVGSTTLELAGVSRVGASSAPADSAAPSAPSPPTPVPVPPSAVPPAPADAGSPVGSAKRPRAPVVPAGRSGTLPELPLGSVFAGCRVEEVVGRGDMGVVYRAEELALQRPVALKLIVAEYSGDERFRERFRRESRIAAAIDHPNILPVFDAGDEAGVLYIMMRFVKGPDLGEVIATHGRLEPPRAAQITRQVGDALDAAHARGMLHRDVKPSNVLLGRRDHVYLGDFGLAKPAGSAGGLTRQGTVVARAEYVAPEQILNERVDARADTYALGCVLFEALTGEPPFARWAGGPGPLAHLDAPPPSPLDLCPDLPEEFDDVVRRAMAKDPSERYPSAGDLGQAALVAAGELRRASPWSVVARGDAAASFEEQVAQAQTDPSPTPAPDGAHARSSDVLRWVLALAGLAMVAAGMVAALHGISTL